MFNSTCQHNQILSLKVTNLFYLQILTLKRLSSDYHESFLYRCVSSQARQSENAANTPV